MRLRLILSFVFIVLVSVTSVVIIARQSAAREVRAFMFRGGMTELETLVESLEGYYQTHQTWAGVENLLASPGRGQGRGPGGPGMMGGMMDQRIRLTDEQGNLIFDSADPQAGGQLAGSELEQAIRLQNGLTTIGYLLPEGGMGFTRGDERVLLNRLNRAALTAGIISGTASLLIALVLAYTLLRPVRELTHAARHLAEGDLSQRVPVRGNDELADLGKTFNHMADSLQHAEESRQAMTADIAHELRNPLAVQRVNLEALQDGVYPLTAENLAPILEQNFLLTRLVEDLRTLVLADAGRLALERTPTDFPGLVARVKEMFEPQAGAGQIDLQYHNSLPPTFPKIPIDPVRVEQIISNLLSNALRYTPQGGSIVLTLGPQPDGLQLSVRDTGPGIPADAIPHIFERFYRAERSRSRTEGGTGLGLAIALQLTHAHGGSLKASNHPGGGAVFTLNLPLDSAENGHRKEK